MMRVLDHGYLKRIKWKTEDKMMNLLHVRRKQEVSRNLISVYFDSKQCKLKVEKVINGRVQTVNSKEDLYLLIEVGYYYERLLRDNLR